jgi:Flp pilus assembly protein TadB
VAPTKRKRRSTKHRGNAAGMVETRGRTGRKPGPADRKSAARKARMDRFSKPPTVRSAMQRSSIAAIVFIAAMILIVHQTVAASIALGGFVLLFYVPLSYYTDLFFYRRRQAKQREQREGKH